MTLESLKAKLLSDPETKKYYNAMKSEFDKVREDIKSRMEKYECRTGHTIGDWADFGWSHKVIGKEYSYVIIKKDFP